MYKIAIPSKERALNISNKTLKLLNKYSIDIQRIFIFVKEDELETYKKELPNYNIICGSDTISKQRESISDYFEENELIVSLDDDVTDILCNGKSLENLDIFINDTFSLLKENNLTLCGIYPVNNKFFLKNTITTDLRFCIGQMKMFINKKGLEKRTYNLLEDYENTIKHYQFSGGVMRYNYITLNANYNSAKGGLKNYRTVKRKLLEVNNFIKEYSNYSKSKKEGTEIKLLTKHSRDILKTLWIGKLNELAILSYMSWLKLDYNIEIYQNNLKLPKILKEYVSNGRIILKKAKDILDIKSVKNILPNSDLFRYKLLYKTGGVWIDSDMVLLKRLPIQETIISSEHTFQSGAFKSILDYVSNIGVLKFEKDNKLLEKVIMKIENNKKKDDKITKNMTIFRDIVKKTEYKIERPEMFCGVPWWCCEEIYYNDSYTTKYAVEVLSNDEIINTSTGIHLWNNFSYTKHNIDFTKIHSNSLYKRLCDIIF